MCEEEHVTNNYHALWLTGFTRHADVCLAMALGGSVILLVDICLKQIKNAVVRMYQKSGMYGMCQIFNFQCKVSLVAHNQFLGFQHKYLNILESRYIYLRSKKIKWVSSAVKRLIASKLKVFVCIIYVCSVYMYYVYTLNKIINANLFFDPIFNELISKIEDFFYIHKGLFLSNFVSQICLNLC